MKAKLAIGCLILASCGTPEFRAEKQSCEADWLMKIPPQYEQRLMNLTRYEQRPSGQITCHNFGATTQCNQAMISVAIPYQEWVTVDVKASVRDPQIAQCAAAACTAKYGNAECKPAT